MSAWADARGVITQGVAARVFPGASVEVGGAEAARWADAIGAVTYEADAERVTPATVYDLASLTKPVATATVAMRLVDASGLDLASTVAVHEPSWSGQDRERVSVQDLMEHAAGLPAWAALWRDHAGRDAVVSAACRAALEYAPRSRSLYSDLGFIVLGAVLECAGGGTLQQQFARVWSEADACREEDPLCFLPAEALRRRAAPTRLSDARERLLIGQVDDDNAWAMGGVAGHAGLFGTAAAVGAFARVLLGVLQGDGDAERRLCSRDVLARFLRPSSVPGSSRALAWDLMRPTSSCGRLMSASAFGHTGFTGTSLWIDPARDFYAVLLTNRVHPAAGPNEPMQDVRRGFHDALLEGAA